MFSPRLQIEVSSRLSLQLRLLCIVSFAAFERLNKGSCLLALFIPTMYFKRRETIYFHWFLAYLLMATHCHSWHTLSDPAAHPLHLFLFSHAPALPKQVKRTYSCAASLQHEAAQAIRDDTSASQKSRIDSMCWGIGYCGNTAL